MLNTGDLFRSSDLGVMSPARCLCATPVGFQLPFNRWRIMQLVGVSLYAQYI